MKTAKAWWQRLPGLRLLGVALPQPGELWQSRMGARPVFIDRVPGGFVTFRNLGRQAAEPGPPRVNDWTHRMGMLAFRHAYERVPEGDAVGIEKIEASYVVPPLRIQPTAMARMQVFTTSTSEGKTACVRAGHVMLAFETMALPHPFQTDDILAVRIGDQWFFSSGVFGQADGHKMWGALS